MYYRLSLAKVEFYDAQGLRGLFFSCIPDKLLWYTLFGAKVPRGVEGVCWMYFRTHVVSVCDSACIPEGPSCQSCCAGYAGGVGLQEVEFIGRIVVDCTGDEDEEG